MPGAVPLDYIFTVCASAAGETCPVWPGHPTTAHWGIADPAHVEPLAARREAFEVAYAALEKAHQGLSHARSGVDVAGGRGGCRTPDS